MKLSCLVEKDGYIFNSVSTIARARRNHKVTHWHHEVVKGVTGTPRVSKKEVPQEWVTLRPGLLTGWTLSTNQLESRTKSHTYSWGLLSWGFTRARETHKKEKPRIDTVTGITDTNFLSNATGNGDRKCIWQKDSVCVTGTFLSSAGVFVVPRARVKETPWHKKLMFKWKGC